MNSANRIPLFSDWGCQVPEVRPGKGPTSAARKPGQPGKPGGKPSEWPGQPGTQPGDEWGEDNPGNVHAVGVEDHVFFHRDGAGPHAGKVMAHGVHGCTVDDDRGTRHRVRWGRVLGLKQKAVLSGKVVDKGVGGAILEHAGGRRVFVAGELPVEDAQPRLSSLTDLEQRAGAERRPKMADLEEFARASAKERDLAKADHDCDGPALCGVCRAQAEEPEPLTKSIAAGVDTLAQLAQRLRSRPRSVLALGQAVPMLLVPSRED